MQIRVVGIDTPCLVPDFSEKDFSLSLGHMMLAVDLSYMVFIISLYIISRFISPWSDLLRELYHEMMLSVIKCLCIYWDNFIIFTFYSVNVTYNIISFVHVEPHLHSKNKSHLIMCSWFSWLEFCWEFLFIKNIGLYFSCHSLMWWLYQCNIGLVKWVKTVLFSAIFGKILGKTGESSF